MEFKQVVGRRRSIRFFEPDKPVEHEKIQVILETARLASCAVNAHWLRAIVVERDKLPKEKLEDAGALAPTHGWSHRFVDEFVYPQLLEPMTNNLQGYLAAAMADCGGAAQNALLAAFDEGLGACLNTPNPVLTKQVFGVQI